MKRVLILALVISAIFGVVMLKKSGKTNTPLPVHTLGIPRLLDLGSKGCTACTLLEPVLEALREKHAGHLQVDFIDVWEHEQVATDFDIELIPVQIFFDAAGNEIDRHQGFITMEEIEDRFIELGVSLHAE